MFYVTEQLSEHIGETPEGFLLCRDVPLTRIGEFEYTSAEVPVEGGLDGVVKIQRDEDEVFNERAIASFEGKPVTINHPNDMVTPLNWKEFAHGTLQNVRRGDGEMSDLMVGDILVTTSQGIELVKSGLREVSLGYDAEYEQIEKGRGRQRNIVGNHVALVTRGRAGGRCAIQDRDSVGENIITKEDVINMKAKDLFKRIFPKSRFADSLEDADLGEPAPVEGADDAEKAAQAATEAKAAAEQAVAAAQQASESAQAAAESQAAAPEVKEEIVSDEGEGLEEGAAEGEGAVTLEAISERLSKLEDLVQELLDLELGEEGAPGGEELPEEGRVGDAEEKEEGWEEEEFQDVASNAEIIDPEVVIAKPTKDKAAYFKKVKVAVLKRALTSDHASLISPLLKGKDVESLRSSELSGIFVAASRMIGAVRDSQVQVKSLDTAGYFRKANSEISKISQKNKDFWTKKK